MPLECARNLITKAAEKLHSGCLLFAPPGTYRELYQSFVCGASLSDPSLSRLYTELGLIHIVVVSGAHLLFLDSVLRFFHRDSSAWTLPVLGFYTLVTGFEPPVVRSLLQMIVRIAQKRWQLQWTLPVETLAAGLLTVLILGPSLSLQLSWVASLALSPQRSALRTQLRVYLYLIPLLATLQIAHPVTVLVNLAMAPVISAVAFPASLLCFLGHQLTWVVDPFWSVVHSVLGWLRHEVFLTPAPASLTRGLWTWLYVGGLQVFLLFTFWARSRKGEP